MQFVHLSAPPLFIRIQNTCPLSICVRLSKSVVNYLWWLHLEIENRSTYIWVNLLCTQERHKLLGSFLSLALITGYGFNSAQWLPTSGRFSWARLSCLALAPGDVFTVRSVWLTRGKNRWIVDVQSLLTSFRQIKELFNKRPTFFTRGIRTSTCIHTLVVWDYDFHAREHTKTVSTVYKSSWINTWHFFSPCLIYFWFTA